MKNQVNARWANAAMVCAKCQKKIKGGFGEGGKQTLSKALRKHLGVKKGRKGHIGIVETKCLGVCPKNAVTVVNAARMDQWLLVAPGADLDEVAQSLGLARE